MGTTNSNSFMGKLIAYGEGNRFGLISMLVIFTGCFGGILVGLAGFENDLVLISLIITTMTTLALVLSVQPMKYIVPVALVTVAVDVLLLLFVLLT